MNCCGVGFVPRVRYKRRGQQQAVRIGKTRIRREGGGMKPTHQMTQPADPRGPRAAQEGRLYSEGRWWQSRAWWRARRLRARAGRRCVFANSTCAARQKTMARMSQALSRGNIDCYNPRFAAGTRRSARRRRYVWPVRMSQSRRVPVQSCVGTKACVKPLRMRVLRPPANKPRDQMS